MLGLGPLPVPPHAFALDGGRLLYGRFQRSDGRFDFQEFHETPLAPDSFQPGPLGGLLREPEALRERIETLLETITAPVSDASLVLPDAWLRLAFTELDERPRRLGNAEEVLRWKLGKQVPFRVDDLRLRGVTAAPLPGRTTGYRVLLGFAMEQLLGQLEQAFGGRGVRIGLVVNASLALCQALGGQSEEGERLGLVLVAPSGYSLVFLHGGRLTFHRFRAIGSAAVGDGSALLVQRDLRLTRDYLRRETDEPAPDGFLVVAPPELEERWQEWVANGFEAEAIGLRAQHLPLQGEVPHGRLMDVSTLLGAACHQV